MSTDFRRRITPPASESTIRQARNLDEAGVKQSRDVIHQKIKLSAKTAVRNSNRKRIFEGGIIL
jgi:hypothetical protein